MNIKEFLYKVRNEIKYIQACYDLSDEKTRNREFSAFDSIDDNYPKYVISMNDEDYSQKGVKCLNIFDFLLDDNF